MQLRWEVASRCDCWSEDTRQPDWDCKTCDGLGVAYTRPVTIGALFRSQGRWTSHRPSGEHGLGEASLTTRMEHKPGYTDERVRDRYTVTAATDDPIKGRIFYPAAQAVPFIIASRQRAWRVQLAAMDQDTRVKPQP